MSQTIQGLWIGKELSTLEKLSISSFLKNGHEYHLYVYEDVKNVPDGTTIKDGNEIIGGDKIFSYQVGEGRGSYSAFSNFFRYKLLFDKGGWWADTDMICLQPFSFEEKYVFATELYQGRNHVTSGIIKAQAGSEAIKHGWEVCQNKDTNKLVWGEVGPRLVSEIVEKHSLQEYVKPYETFCPLGFESWAQILNPNVELNFSKNTYAVHLWNEMWRRNSMHKDISYHSKCLYEQFKEKYLS